jgi:hypothetical protein
MGDACRTRETDKKYVQCFRRKPLRDHSEDAGVDGRIILEWVSGK